MDQRAQVRMLKVFKNVSYASIADELGINHTSFYNWLRGQYHFSHDRAVELQNIIDRYGLPKDRLL